MGVCGKQIAPGCRNRLPHVVFCVLATFPGLQAKKPAGSWPNWEGWPFCAKHRFLFQGKIVALSFCLECKEPGKHRTGGGRRMGDGDGLHRLAGSVSCPTIWLQTSITLNTDDTGVTTDYTRYKDRLHR